MTNQTKELNIDQLVQDDKNFNKGTAEGQKLMDKSLGQFGAGRSILIDKNDRIIAGNKTAATYQALGNKKVRVIETTGDELIAVKRIDVDLDSKEGREMALADNATSKANLDWDEEVMDDVFGEFGIDGAGWGVDMLSMDDKGNETPAPQESEDEEIERKKREFEERMAAGELDEDDPEYQEFLKKFEAKKTTDDCYTPDLVYNAIADWVAEFYNLSRAKFKRPFYPGGDYQNETYAKDEVVVDNPPFSILAGIIDWYNEHGVKYFLFGPHLTLLGTAAKRCTCLPIGVTITYANGAKINTSFVTNLDPEDVVMRSEPKLYKIVTEANDENMRQMRKELPKYSYPKHVIMAPLLQVLSRYGIEFVVRRDECYPISELDSQKAEGKAIYGKGYLVSDRIVAEREKAEREKAEREKAEREKATAWELSERERAIIATLK